MKPSEAFCASQYKTFLQQTDVLSILFQCTFVDQFLFLIIKVIAVVPFPLPELCLKHTPSSTILCL